MLDVLTAKHGHDSSPQPTDPSPSGTLSFLPQVPFQIFNSVLPKQTSSPALPTAVPDPPRPLQTAPSTKPTRLMTSEPGTPLHSPPHSRPASVSSSTASFESKPKKRAHRPKTTYNLAQPPPASGPRHKLHLRPKVLLQLHQVIPGRRPKPVYEVIPFSLLAPRSTRRLARTFNSKERLGPHDLLVVRAEPYENITTNEERSDDERWGTRDVVGIICPARRSDKDPSDKTELLLDDGSSWEVSNMPNGGYEFSFTDEHGLTLKRRWVPKTPHNRRTSTMSNAPHSPVSPALAQEDRKFNFSTISPNSRRHPIIGSISRTSIDVLDAYTIPCATTPSTPGLTHSTFATPLPTPASIPESVSFLEKSTEQLPTKTDDALRMFIVLSGIWVAFSENWSPAYSSSKGLACPPTTRPFPNRAVSMSFVDTPRSASPASTIEENHRSPLPKLFRSSTHKASNGHSPPASVSPSTPSTHTAPPSTTPALKTRSRRSNSTGNAELISRNSSSRKRHGLAFEDQSLVETEEERQSKRSIELLRIKELALTTPSAPAPAPSSAPTADLLPPPIQILEPAAEDEEDSRDPSPVPPAERTRKTQSAYNPVTTKGLWDSGVIDDPGSKKKRPTSLVVLKSKKEKEKKKQERGKSREKEREREKEQKTRDGSRKPGGLRRLLSFFHRHKG